MEDSGHLLMMLAAIVQRQNGNVGYLSDFAPALLSWADYLNSALP